MRVFGSEKFSWWDSCYADLFDKEPGKLKVARSVGHVRWESVVIRELDLGHVDEDEVTALRVGVLEWVSITKLMSDPISVFE